LRQKTTIMQNYLILCKPNV